MARRLAAVALCTERFTSSASLAQPAPKSAPFSGSASMKPLLSAWMPPGNAGGVDARLHADRQHAQVVRVGVAVVALGVDAVQDRIAGGLVLGDVGDLGLDERDVRLASTFW
jgi:hypothetical protein